MEEEKLEYVDGNGMEYLIELLKKEKMSGRILNTKIDIIEFLETFSHVHFRNMNVHMNVPLINKSSVKYIIKNIETKREEKQKYVI